MSSIQTPSSAIAKVVRHFGNRTLDITFTDGTVVGACTTSLLEEELQSAADPATREILMAELGLAQEAEAFLEAAPSPAVFKFTDRSKPMVERARDLYRSLTGSGANCRSKHQIARLFMLVDAKYRQNTEDPENWIELLIERYEDDQLDKYLEAC